MQTKQGFTLIELLFGLSLILIMSSITFSKSNFRINNENKILMAIENAQSYALKHKVKVYLDFKMDQLCIYTNDYTLNNIYLSNHEQFFTEKVLYFNEMGHISQGASIRYKRGNQLKTLIFNLGMGRYYLQE